MENHRMSEIIDNADFLLDFLTNHIIFANISQKMIVGASVGKIDLEHEDSNGRLVFS